MLPYGPRIVVSSYIGPPYGEDDDQEWVIVFSDDRQVETHVPYPDFVALGGGDDGPWVALAVAEWYELGQARGDAADRIDDVHYCLCPDSDGFTYEVVYRGAVVGRVGGAPLDEAQLRVGRLDTVIGQEQAAASRPATRRADPPGAAGGALPHSV